MVILKPPNPMTNNDAPSKKHRTAIIGVGDVGAAVANALILRSVTDEVLINDTDSILREAQIYDLSDVSYVCGGQIRVRAATHREAGQADIVIITIGSRHFRGRNRVKLKWILAESRPKADMLLKTATRLGRRDKRTAHL